MLLTLNQDNCLLFTIITITGASISEPHLVISTGLLSTFYTMAYAHYCPLNSNAGIVMLEFKGHFSFCYLRGKRNCAELVTEENVRGNFVVPKVVMEEKYEHQNRE